MERRTWLKGAGLMVAAASLGPFRSFASPAVKGGFVPDAGDGVIRLSSNENPYGPSPMTREAMERSINVSNRYQWKIIQELAAAIAAKNGVGADNVLIGAGSTQVMDMVIQFAALQKGNFVLANPTFGRWADSAERQGLRKIEVPLNGHRQHDLAAMLAAINKDTRMVYVCNPNNPTGTISDHDELRSFVKSAAKESLVLVDEAYIDYSNEVSLAKLAIEIENVVVVKTFSKIYGMAGARIGYALAHKSAVEKLSQLQSGANVGVGAMSMGGALASLKDDAFVRTSFLQNREARAYTIEQLERLHIRCIPSHTNFIYFSLEDYKKDFFGLLKSNNIEGTKIFDADGKWSRITVGTMHEMELFIAALSR